MHRSTCIVCLLMLVLVQFAGATEEGGKAAPSPSLSFELELNGYAGMKLITESYVDVIDGSNAIVRIGNASQLDILMVIMPHVETKQNDLNGINITDEEMKLLKAGSKVEFQDITLMIHAVDLTKLEASIWRIESNGNTPPGGESAKPSRKYIGSFSVPL